MDRKLNSEISGDRELFFSNLNGINRYLEQHQNDVYTEKAHFIIYHNSIVLIEGYITVRRRTS